MDQFGSADNVLQMEMHEKCHSMYLGEIANDGVIYCVG